MKTPEADSSLDSTTYLNFSNAPLKYATAEDRARRLEAQIPGLTIEIDWGGTARFWDERCSARITVRGMPVTSRYSSHADLLAFLNS